MGVYISKGFPGGLAGKEFACNAGDLGSIPGSWRSPGGENGTTLQYSCLENPMDRGAWQATVHGVTNGDRTERLIASSFCFFKHFRALTLKVLVQMIWVMLRGRGCTFPGPFLRGDGPCTLSGPWQRGCGLPVLLRLTGSSVGNPAQHNESPGPPGRGRNTRSSVPRPPTEGGGGETGVLWKCPPSCAPQFNFPSPSPLPSPPSASKHWNAKSGITVLTVGLILSS